VAYIKYIQSGNILETYEFERAPSPYSRRKKSIRRRKGHRKLVERRFSSIRRSTANFRRLIWANLDGGNPPALLTLTMLQELPLAASGRLLTQTFTRIRAEKGREFRYIAVPEFQKRGAVHFHCLIWGLNEEIEEERTTRYFQRLWLRGFVDGLVTDGSPKLAGYLAKYLSKTMSDIRLAGKKAYYSSRNILRPVSLSVDTRNQYKLEIIENQVIHRGEVTTQKTFDTMFLGRCIYQSTIAKIHESYPDEKDGNKS